ncbi:hypothetical protein [Natronohydrobacter thiooxidans]|uniref:hypothetical protein n=1 Tax=Natronohydrobacter thiooxidans TaxID=87172 RepID=UPI000AE17954|nr:hypothetical protein [Natronohydrobacter thiooxidans]
MAEDRSKKAVLVLPDMGLSEEQIDGLKGEFQNNIADTIRRAASASNVSVIVTVVIVF